MIDEACDRVFAVKYVGVHSRIQQCGVGFSSSHMHDAIRVYDRVKAGEMTPIGQGTLDWREATSCEKAHLCEKLV